ncbi:MAG TPA: redox-sensing transcriptional repressor Rex [Ignavibacteriales bacterium]|jgi:redox-sensing transcriptional repressor|nr:redox-sensing transcriptional repressor Rex [Ignavibacteriales bacterium]
MTTNKHSILRLSKYKNSLNKLRSLGFKKVFSDNLADAAGVTPAQVRKDFSQFGISGNKRGGYSVEELVENLNRVLGKDRVQNVIIIGTGNIGSALIKYKGFEKEGIRIVGAFDIDAAKLNPQNHIPILHLDEMPDFIHLNNVKIAIIAVPDIFAQSVFDIAVEAGVKGFLNFSPVRLRGPEDVILNNVDFYAELEKIIYFVTALDRN